MSLRKEAKGRNCMVRLPGICCFDNDTTVLAHVRISGVSGMGIKSDDALGAWACYPCHMAIDGQTKTAMTREELRLAHLEGMARTIAVLRKEGLL